LSHAHKVFTIDTAQALGQKSIEARVIVCQVAGPLPWDVPAGTAHA